ncbi:hypothetical protein [Thermococcus sp. GR4]|uniref:hypothetical protein n=1 Tax=Thermococcus sp. GR4 TaxID=1638254 RepID=UPI00142FA2FB|nr:hypothetical protein [Thermococcus sp. GR4]NJE79576.1 hypothetical protein [Thermococcus sp. GR4]
MGFRNLLRKAGEVTKKAIDRAGKEVKWRKKVGEAKREILARFSVQQLKKIAASKGISLVYEDPITGERQRLTTKTEIVGRLARNLSFEEVVDLARRYKVRYSDIVQELEKFRQELFEEKSRKRSEKEALESIYEADEYEAEEVNTEDMLDVFDSLRDFRPIGGFVKDEDDLKNQIASWLAHAFGPNNVQVEVPIERYRVDIVVEDRVAIEVKIASSVSKLQRLLGQMRVYKDYFDDVIAVILDIGKDVDLERYITKLRRDGVRVLVIEGKKTTKKKGKKREVVIRIQT